MRVFDAATVRNVALVGHSSAGKTQLASALVFDAGAVNRLGKVDEGTTVTDYDEEAIARKHTLGAALASFEWTKLKINLIDTPGVGNFLGDARAALRVAELAVVVVDAVSGVQVSTEKVISKMGGLDLMILNAGIGFLNPELDWSKETQTINVNVQGFCALAGLSYKYFTSQGGGHIVGISSIGALRGNHHAPAYNASKAFMSNYLEGLRKKAYKEKIPITVTDIKPGFVDTDMAKGEGKFWVASPKKAAEQIYTAIKAKKKHAYITHRWRLIGWMLKLMPDWLYLKI